MANSSWDFMISDRMTFRISNFSKADTTDLCERCKPHNKCLGLQGLSEKAWKKSASLHTAVVDAIIEEIPVG